MSQPISPSNPASTHTGAQDEGKQTNIELVQVLQGHSDRAWSVAWHLTRPILASSSTDKQLRLYQYHLRPNPLDATTPKLEFQYIDSIPSAHTRTVRSIDWSPKGDLLASGSFDSTASIWTNHNFDRRLDQADALDSEDEPGRAGSPILDGEGEGEESWECLMSLEGHESEVKGVAWNRNGNLLATCSRDKSVWIWEILVGHESQDHQNVIQDDEGYEVISVLMEHEQDVKSVCWSPVEDLLCSTSYDNNIHLYAEDVTADGDFTLLHRLKGHQSTVWDSSFSPCGEFLASCSDDLSIRIWHREKLPQGGVEGRDGGLTGGWRIGRSERERWTCISVLSGYHSRTIYSIDWTFAQLPQHTDSQSLGMIVTCGGDGIINLLKLSKGVPVSGLDSSSAQPDVVLLAQRKKGHGTSDINDVVWCKLKAPTLSSSNPEQTDWRTGVHQLFASSGDDGSVRVWRITEN
ncbi:Cytosolic iron-sulfur protein assembly protein [Puccinia graminis f. sp. tritici]|uniref:Probable cytosolic iron-sulfur protein assembly protein 1 n=1 Tax=Puccinia graminis f. sp. tritici TaxID=56615 RepID=A0A5B0LKA0_PUCGR|nr:Cytosolic iron-sulfur protein assembly protein [Puccinia graminis f. sp. tritici]